MKSSRHPAPQINAGSMADIAFLLLIFFLVTAMIPKDQGFQRKLPQLCPPGQVCDTDIAERNVLEIMINSNNQLLVENELITLSKLKPLIISFLDNNGRKECDYCEGLQFENLSDHPTKAVVSLKNDPATSYDFYIEVQDELTQAYYELRSRYAKHAFGKTVDELSAEEIKISRDAYPFLLSEADMKRAD